VDRSSFRNQSSPRRSTRSRSRTRELTDDFQLPVDGLFGDFSTGAGSVRLPDEFVRMCAALQLSIVRDWQQGLEGAREQALVLLYRETVGASTLPLPQRLARFREVCEQHGEDCPSDMARLLQQY